MFKNVVCLACGYTLYRIGPLDEKGLAWGLFEEDQEKFDSMRKGQYEKEYFECPQCKKKNWIVSKKVEGLGLQEWISHATE